MSDITKGLRAYLITRVPVRDLVGTRIYADLLPQKDGRVTVDSPAVTLEVVSGASESDLRGGIGIGVSRVSVTCYASTRSAANAVAEAIRRELLRLRGAAGDERVRSVVGESVQDMIDAPEEGNKGFRYLKIRDYSVTHAEAVAAYG